MNTKEDIKGCKKCNGKGHVDGVPCSNCCTHEGRPMRDPEDAEKFVCGHGCGARVKAPKL